MALKDASSCTRLRDGSGSGVRDRGTFRGLDPAFCRALGEAVARGTTQEGTGVRWVIDRTTNMPDELPVPRLAGAEQSNTSLIFGDRAIMKLYRRLEPGEHPDAEIARFLTTRAHFANTPELLATARFDSASGFEVAAMTQRFLPDRATPERGARARTCRVRAEAPAGIPFVVEGRRWGASRARCTSRSPRTNAIPRSRLSGHRARCRGMGRCGAHRDYRALRSSSAIAPTEAFTRHRPGVDSLLERRDVVPGWWMRITLIGSDAGRRIRHHGDYHLGQVLRLPMRISW